MDFAALVGSSAYLARQLELRWFYHWEHDVSYGSNQSATTTSSSSPRVDHAADADGQSNSIPLEQRTLMHGRLVRKFPHSMPFLRRNVIAHKCDQRSRNRESKRKRVRPSLTFGGGAPENPLLDYSKRAQASVSSTNLSNRYIRQSSPTARSRASLGASSAWLLTDQGAAHTSACLMSGATSALLTPNIQLRSKHNTTAQNPTHLPRAYFHYLFMQPNDVPATVVEEIDGRICPLCKFDGKNNVGLLSHCGIYHGKLNGTNSRQHDASCVYFEAVLGEEGQLHVIVRGVPTRSADSLSTTHMHDNKFVYIGPRFCASPKNSQSLFIGHQVKISFLERRPDKVASLDSVTRSKRLLALQSSDAPASVISAYLPNDKLPIRQYYHSHTTLPMTNDDWMGDSDDDIDEDWVQDMSSELINEFEDVASEEKHFLTIWNRFIKSNHVIGDRDMPGKCHQFILTHRNQLIDAGLRLQLLLHLFNLWDAGVISSNRIRHCMALFDGTTKDKARAVEEA